MSTLQLFSAFVLVVFSAYSLYCLKAENFWQSLAKVWQLKWGKQVIFDLYVGLFLFSYFVYQNEKSLLIALAWTVASLILGNPITLLYFVIYFAAA